MNHPGKNNVIENDLVEPEPNIKVFEFEHDDAEVT